jgi:hypothetical protein
MDVITELSPTRPCLHSCMRFDWWCTRRIHVVLLGHEVLIQLSGGFVKCKLVTGTLNRDTPECSKLSQRGFQSKEQFNRSSSATRPDTRQQEQGASRPAESHTTPTQTPHHRPQTTPRLSAKRAPLRRLLHPRGATLTPKGRTLVRASYTSRRLEAAGLPSSSFRRPLRVACLSATTY